MSEFISRGRVRGVSLKAVRAFCESARLGSFKGAAEELNVTPSAISHQIKALEEYLDVELFERGIREVVLTPAGARYADQAREGLKIIDRATTELLVLTKRTSVRVAVAPFLGTRWFMARMAEFESSHPDITLEVVATTQTISTHQPDTDVIVRLGPEPTDTGHYELLFRERLLPVASPERAAKVKELADLPGQPLLDVASRPGEWEHFLEQTLGSQSRMPHKLDFQNNSPAVEAAVSGLGVTLADPLLVRQELRSGQLVGLLEQPINGKHAYWLVLADHAVENRRVERFVSWLKSAVAAEPLLQGR